MTIAVFPPPPYPGGTRAKGWRFELDHERIGQSDTWALASPQQRPWLLMLWLVAWQQTPCGSIPDNDELIAVRIGMPADEFEQHRSILLRRWEKATDGRLYHPVITEQVLEMLARKARETQRKSDYRARQKSQVVPGMSHGTDARPTRDSAGSDDTSTGTRGKPLPISNDIGCRQAEPGNVPDCPHQEIIDLYHRVLPMGRQVRIWNDTRQAKLRARWREDSKRQRIEWWERFFSYVADSDFLTGRTNTPGRSPFELDLEWIITPRNLVKIVEGKYHQQEDAA